VYQLQQSVHVRTRELEQRARDKFHAATHPESMGLMQFASRYGRHGAAASFLDEWTSPKGLRRSYVQRVPSTSRPSLPRLLRAGCSSTKPRDEFMWHNKVIRCRSNAI
jgi:hypothetical protein